MNQLNFDLSLRQFIDLASSSEPTPSGGSVAAVAAALGASMTNMVAKLSQGNKYEEYKEEIDSVIRYVDSSIEQSEKLMQKDIEAFTTFMAAYKLPKETTEQKEIRFHSIQQALIKATEIPLEIARLGVETMEQTLKIVSYANRTAISDLGVSAYLLSASVSSVLLTVDINLPLIKDEISVKHYQQNRDLLDSKSKSLKNSIATTVNQRINS